MKWNGMDLLRCHLQLRYLGLSCIRMSAFASGKWHAVCHSTQRSALGKRHGGWPSDQQSPAPTNSWKANGRSVHQPANRYPDQQSAFQLLVGVGNRWSNGHLPCRSLRPTIGWRGCLQADDTADATSGCMDGRMRLDRHLWT